MADNENLAVMESSPEVLDNLPGRVIDFSFEAAEQKMSFAINIMNEEATLADIVMPARKMSSKIAIAHREMIARKGQIIPCKKGCCACCSSLIPMSVPEVFRMREEFLEMPGQKCNKLLRDCIYSAEKILKKTENKECLNTFAEEGRHGVSQINKWYGELGLVCPFLSKSGLCKIYAERPLACREHIVIGASDSCQKKNMCRPNVEAMDVSVLESLGQLASELEGTEVEAVMLPFSLAWAQDNLARAEHKWPAEKMVRRFAEILQEKSEKSSLQDILQK
ncbi:MAG: YkgJ family cysteine cluster protein [Planctomycetaceae bacterium]|nr:YkgJ family cysteine cluster protein [Planctomycetaceae bacterium]